MSFADLVYQLLLLLKHKVVFGIVQMHIIYAYIDTQNFNEFLFFKILFNELENNTVN